MLSYPFIENVFQTILDQSILIAGRFHVCPKWGGELNNINIDENIPNALPGKPKYPAALLMPPPLTGQLQFNDNEAGSPLFDIHLLFVTTATHTQQNAIANPAPSLQSQHTVPQTWHDMLRCAVSFLRVLRETTLAQNLSNEIFISERTVPEFYPVTDMANDKVSGVMVKFKLGVSVGCGVEDYNEDYITRVALPAATDTHPLHLGI